MIVHSYLRQIAVELIWMLVDHDRMRKDDIRWVKDNQGVFPQRIIKAERPDGSTETKKTPYQPDSDLLIVFDVVPQDNIASEAGACGIASMWPFDLVINAYGRDADYITQRIRAKLHGYKVISWLSALNISFNKMSVNTAILDGFENQTWWIRRKMIINMNISQIVEYDKDDELVEVDRVKIVFGTVTGEEDEGNGE